jgi:hypothetical protein
LAARATGHWLAFIRVTAAARDALIDADDMDESELEEIATEMKRLPAEEASS